MDALLHLVDRAMAAGEVIRPRRDRYVALLHLRTDVAKRAAHLHGGPALPDSVRRHLTCDGHVRPVQEVGGRPVSVGRTQRTVPDRTRVVVEDRDRGCRVPGCDRHRWLHVHHIVHWEDGGPTDTANLLAPCPVHHRLHHRGLLGITGNGDDPDGVRFTDHLGRELRPHAPPTPPGRPSKEAAHRLGIVPGRWAHPTGERLDHHWVNFRQPPSPN